MSSTPCRKFSILDAMVLVAATAVGLAFLRASVGDFSELGARMQDSVRVLAGPLDHWGAWGLAIYSTCVQAAALSIPFGWAWSVAILLLRLRRPRPRRRRLACQPGAIACYSAAITLVPAITRVVGVALMSGMSSGFREMLDWVVGTWFVFVPALAGFAVIGSWATLLLGRRWRPEPSWIDRAGRVLGVYWIATTVFPLWGMF
jgi:hypothetical protein